MDRYTERLIEEWQQHGKIIIAVDFDDTISPWKFNSDDDNSRYSKIIDTLRIAKETGAYIVVFTACNTDRHQNIKEYCSSKRLEIDAINETPIKSIPYGRNGSKIYANIFLDDRAGLNEALEILNNAMYTIRGNNFKQITDVI